MDSEKAIIWACDLISEIWYYCSKLSTNSNTGVSLPSVLIKQQLWLRNQHPAPDINSSSRGFISTNYTSSIPGYHLRFWASSI